MKNAQDIKYVSEYLSNHDIKPSFQRVKILQHFMEKKDHPSINDIYDNLSQQIPSLSKTTVYNTVNLFIKKGVLKSINSGEGASRYDLTESMHGHFICSGCEEIYDFDVPKILMDFIPPCADSVTAFELTYTGLCKKCAEKSQK